ncbi:MAG: hypothetical protein ACKO6B_13580 [Planctomycetia bacterium]
MPSSPPPRASLTAWRTAGSRVTDSGSAIPAGIDLDRPRHGITLAGSAGTAAAALLGLDLRSDSRLADHWVREDDVTAIYETVDARRLRTTAMWRLAPSDGATRAWELVVSAQTSLLQSDSFVAVVSEIDGAVTLWGTFRDGDVHWHTTPSPEATCVLVQRDGQTDAAAESVLVVAHPGDARRVTVRKDGGRTVLECWLFSTALEKGVLLRSRVLAAVGPTDNAGHWATRLATSFAASPPMLTT